MKQPLSNQIGYVNTTLAYHLRSNPTTLTDQQWAEQYAQLQYLINQNL